MPDWLNVAKDARLAECQHPHLYYRDRMALAAACAAHIAARPPAGAAASPHPPAAPPPPGTLNEVTR
ncbi:hypothetical protein CHLRE_17g733689v5 [Chlamydomonas reinhardtii]|uniref:Uncharacterized protein n=1 Tax=Chlamydomonas reinhardtii TaxID=3055 RepID=A0A2K3CR69_CHLRE|nr:uncharacterized protein CHLRE_17g733689v5 [Chlamydomonas reinhardtii]PNW70776.1 hypothetical protein CHLRE_17g733689v5 [Chlamydomonas reinhardtii]